MLAHLNRLGFQHMRIRLYVLSSEATRLRAARGGEEGGGREREPVSPNHLQDQVARALGWAVGRWQLGDIALTVMHLGVHKLEPSPVTRVRVVGPEVFQQRHVTLREKRCKPCDESEDCKQHTPWP